MNFKGVKKKGSIVNNQRSKEQELLLTLGSLPRNMVSHHGTENLTEFVLHGICQDGFGRGD